MTTWDPETGDREVLTMGGEPSPRRPLRLLTAVAAAGLLAGFMAGGRATSAPDSAVVAEPVQLVAGSVEPLSGGRAAFEVPIHNSSAMDVSVAVVGIPDWKSVPDTSADVDITPGTWQPVRFTAKVNCTEPPFTVRSIVVRTRSHAGTLRTELTLASPGTALRDHHLVECTPARTLAPDQVVGVWMLDEVRGEASWLADRLMIWLRRDGTFTWDAAGELLGSLPSGVGRYVSGDDRLRFRLTGGSGCRPRDLLVWKTRLLPEHRLHLELERSAGMCADGPGQVWVLRRVLNEPRHRLR